MSDTNNKIHTPKVKFVVRREFENEKYGKHIKVSDSENKLHFQKIIYEGDDYFKSKRTGLVYGDYLGVSHTDKVFVEIDTINYIFTGEWCRDWRYDEIFN